MINYPLNTITLPNSLLDEKMVIHYITKLVINTPATAQEIRLARIRHNLKQEDLAKVLSVSRSYIAQLENGLRDISVRTAETLQDYFNSLD